MGGAGSCFGRTTEACATVRVQGAPAGGAEHLAGGDRWYILIIILFYFIFFSPFTAPQVWQLGVIPVGDAINKFGVTVSPLA